MTHSYTVTLYREDLRAVERLKVEAESPEGAFTTASEFYCKFGQGNDIVILFAHLTPAHPLESRSPQRGPCYAMTPNEWLERNKKEV